MCRCDVFCIELCILSVLDFIFYYLLLFFFFFFQAEDGIRDGTVTGVQTCALPISELATLSIALVVVVDKNGKVLGKVLGRNGSALMRGDDLGAVYPLMKQAVNKRSEERRVGKECRSRWATDH